MLSPDLTLICGVFIGDAHLYLSWSRERLACRWRFPSGWRCSRGWAGAGSWSLGWLWSESLPSHSPAAPSSRPPGLQQAKSKDRIKHHYKCESRVMPGFRNSAPRIENCKTWKMTPKIFLRANFGHPITKSWLQPCSRLSGHFNFYLKYSSKDHIMRKISLKYM